MNKVAFGLDFARLRCISYPLLSVVTLVRNCADGEKDTGQLEREKVEPSPTAHSSSGSGSSFGEPVGPEPASPDLVGSDTLTPSNLQVLESLSLYVHLSY